MNIFVTSPCPKLSALYLDKKRRNKMITESMQMMALALYRNNLRQFIPRRKDGEPYKCGSHYNHPCTIWAARTQGNFLWLHEHCYWLYYFNQSIDKYAPRPYIVPSFAITLQGAKYLTGGLEPFQNCARNLPLGLDFTHLPIHDAYIQYLHARDPELYPYRGI